MKKKKRFLRPRNFLLFCALFLFLAVPSSLYSDIQVYFNTATYKVHKLSCRWGKKCTRNCILIPRSKAYQQGGVPCKVCGG